MEEVRPLSERRIAIDDAVAALTDLGDVLWQADGQDLGPLLRQIDDLGRFVEAARVAVLSEAIARGETTHGLVRGHHGWVIEWAPSLRAGGAGQLVSVAAASLEQRNGDIRQALLEARIPVRSAAVCLTELERLHPRLVPEAVPTVRAALLSLAEQEGPREIRRLRPALVARHGAAGELDREQERARQLVRLSAPMHGGDGLFEYELVLDAEGKAVLEAALGPVSGPCPSDDVPDLRPAGQRRAEGLLTLVRRAVSGPSGPPSSGKATVFVTMSMSDLQTERGAGCVTGSAAAGTLLSPGAVRRLACDAGVVPVVFGTSSEVLDLGREWRFFNAAQTKAMWLRDGSCTIPGCGMPGQWCDAHHLWHWCDGGPTDLDHAALLCGYHHSWVHRHRLAGEVVEGRVVWDLARGSYDTYLARIRARGGDAGDDPDGEPACVA